MQAVPSFSSKYEKACSYCHNAFPALNKKGRRFKALGYRMAEDVGRDIGISEYKELGAIPISARIISRPYEDRDSTDAQLRAIAQVQLWVAGALGKHWSTFVDLEAQEENDFDIEVSPAVLNFNYHPAFNIQLGWAPVFWADPYDTLSENTGLTRGQNAVIDQPFGGADGSDGRLLDDRQMVSFWGRLPGPLERLFYIVGASGEADDSEGFGVSNLHLRLAYDITKDIMIGGLIIDGDTDSHTVTSTRTVSVAGIGDLLQQFETTIPDRDFRRYGVDFQADAIWGLGNTRFQGAFVHAEDDNSTAVAEEDNEAWYAQVYHVFKTKIGQPTLVPLIRFDSYEQNDGGHEFDELTFNLTYYLRQNIKAFIEYWTQVDVPDGVQDDDRVTLQLFFAF